MRGRLLTGGKLVRAAGTDIASCGRCAGTFRWRRRGTDPRPVPARTADLYVSILAVLAVGAAYVPVDADDPDERADLVFTEADVCAVVGAGAQVAMRGAAGGRPGRPGLSDDAWIIFTSGSTGRP